jgi:hypothetical protein
VSDFGEGYADPMRVRIWRVFGVDKTIRLTAQLSRNSAATDDYRLKQFVDTRRNFVESKSRKLYDTFNVEKVAMGSLSWAVSMRCMKLHS